MNDDIAISIKNVKKDFHLPHHKNDSLKEAIVQVFKKKDKEVDTHHALRGISFEIRKGEFFGVLGRNGTGKSTLLKILAEIYQPTSGSVKVKGKLVPFIELGVGFNANLTGRENVYLNGALLGFSKKEIDERYDSIVEFAELEAFMDQKLKNYSSGMKVRLAFSVAIRADADILLLDEVLAVGDASFQKKCYEYFDTLKEKKKTIVFVTHNMSAVRKYCDRSVLIEKGKIAHIGSADEIAMQYTKLFEREEKAAQVESDARMDKKVRYDSVDAEVTEKYVDVTFTFKNNTNETFDNLRVFIDIARDNRVVTGFPTTSPPKSSETFSIDGGKKKKLTVRFDNIFGNGDFTIMTTLRDGNSNNDMLDSWRSKVEFTNQYSPTEYYPVRVSAKLEIVDK